MLNQTSREYGAVSSVDVEQGQGQEQKDEHKLKYNQNLLSICQTWLFCLFLFVVVLEKNDKGVNTTEENNSWLFVTVTCWAFAAFFDILHNFGYNFILHSFILCICPSFITMLLDYLDTQVFVKNDQTVDKNSFTLIRIYRIQVIYVIFVIWRHWNLIDFCTKYGGLLNNSNDDTVQINKIVCILFFQFVLFCGVEYHLHHPLLTLSLALFNFSLMCFCYVSYLLGKENKTVNTYIVVIIYIGITFAWKQFGNDIQAFQLSNWLDTVLKCGVLLATLLQLVDFLLVIMSITKEQ